MWFLNRLDPTAADYNIPLGLRLRGEIDHPALDAALRDVLERQEILRTVYPDSVDGPYQWILPVEDVDVSLRRRSVTSEAQLHELCMDVAAEGFDVTAAPPLRAWLFEVAGAAGAALRRTTSCCW